MRSPFLRTQRLRHLGFENVLHRTLISGFRNSLSDLNNSLTAETSVLIFVTVMTGPSSSTSGDLRNHRTYHDRFSLSAFAELPGHYQLGALFYLPVCIN
ncbi:hypothetical protein ABIF97_004093 [Bradyrhizobium japonicum]